MRGMNTTKPIQIFKPGKHTAMSGAALVFSETDLAATAAAYDPVKHEAPLVVGHPQHDMPAYGWVGSLSCRERAGGEGASLEASPHQVDPAFAEMVERGAFKKISASFYTPDAPSNPVPGVYYLRHVGFLGAQPPAVKGLRSPEFAETETGVVEFTEWSDTDNANLWRSLRDWVLGKFGQEDADKAIPGYTVKSLEQSARDELNKEKAVAEIAPAFADPVAPQPKGEIMSAEEKARLAALEAENAQLKKDAASFAEAQIKTKRDALHAEHLAFAEGLVKEGRLLPAQTAVTAAALDHLAGGGNMVEFGEGDDKKPLVDALKKMLAALPKQVEFGEVSKASAPEGEAVEFAAPRGYGAVDAEGLEIHAKALAYQKTNPKTDYFSAVKAVI